MQMKVRKIIVLEGNGYRDSHKGDGWKESQTMYTLNTTEVHGVCYEAERHEKMKLVWNGKCDLSIGGGISFSITGDHDNRPTDMTNIVVEETNDMSRTIVRRLTPVECERLQGFPDGWTDIGEWVDSKGKKHKEADTPRYKALGNSICLPQWWWIVYRMKKYLPEGATLGSLFDGIGGFPLVWEECYGRGTARWASEIEEFPIAVTKIRFPEFHMNPPETGDTDG